MERISQPSPAFFQRPNLKDGHHTLFHYLTPDDLESNSSGTSGATSSSSSQKTNSSSGMRNGRFWLLVWLLATFTFSATAVVLPESSFVKFGERLPYGSGIIIACAHAMAGNLVESCRALVTSLLTAILAHVVLLVPVVVFSFLFCLALRPRDITRQSQKLVYKYWLFLQLFIILFLTIGFFYQVRFERKNFRESLGSSTAPSLRKNWMRDFQDHSLFDLILPGSHDSGAIVGEPTANPFLFRFIEPFSATNQYSITEQLEMGIRYIDLRLCGAANGILSWLNTYKFD